MSVGNRIFLKRNLPLKQLLEAFAEIPTANIADTMGRLCAMHPRIRLMSQPERSIVAGPALTVKSRAGDNLFIHQAMDMAKEGDVIVVSNEADSSRSLMGEVMFRYCEYKRIGALVLDGPIRDVEAVKKIQYPIYATGNTPGGPYKDGPGEINVSVSCGGVVVNPGDIVVMDADGVIVIPLKDGDRVLRDARKFQAQDAAKIMAASNGTANRSWVKKSLEEKQVEIIDGYCGDY